MGSSPSKTRLLPTGKSRLFPSKPPPTKPASPPLRTGDEASSTPRPSARPGFGKRDAEAEAEAAAGDPYGESDGGEPHHPSESDPRLARSLRILGPVTPSASGSAQFQFPPSSSSLGSSSPYGSTSPAGSAAPFRPNTSLQILSARSRLALAAEQEFARVRTTSPVTPPAPSQTPRSRSPGGEEEGEAGKRAGFLDVQMVRRALAMRERGVAQGEIEGVLGLRGGLLGVLGGRGVVGVVGDGGGVDG